MTEQERAAGGTPKYSVASGETRCIEMRGLGQVIPCGIIEDSAYLAAALRVVKAAREFNDTVWGTSIPELRELRAALAEWED